MPKFVLIAGSFEQWDTPLSGDAHAQRCVLGAVFDLPADQAAALIAKGAGLLPQATFDGLKFTPEEIAKYPNARQQRAAPEEFHKKLLAGRIALHNYREELKKEQLQKPEPARRETTGAQV